MHQDKVRIILGNVTICLKWNDALIQEIAVQYAWP